MSFSNDKVRVYHRIPHQDPLYGAVFSNSNPDGPQEQSLERRRIIEFAATADHSGKHVIDFKVDQYIKGLRTFSSLYESPEMQTDPTKYNNFNFTTTELWDSPTNGKSFSFSE